MRIAQVAPLSESVPPKWYGGTERIVAFLSDELVRKGHDVTLFASGDSRTSAKLISSCPKALRLNGGSCDALAPYLTLLEEVAAREDEFDVVHFHTSPIHLPIARRLSAPHVTTLHGRLDLDGLAPLYREYRDVPLVSISESQRRPLRDAGWIATVPHGLPPNLLSYHPEPGRYLAFLGRISPEKRVDRAIAIAVACQQPLRIAAKVDPADRDYFEREIRPLLDHPLVEFVGEIGDADKDAFLGGATALLFPIDWPEPFGLVMIEAMACGVPVVAFRGGSVSEVLEPGVTGFIVETLDEAIEATHRVRRLDRGQCRAVFERRFSVSRMAAEYVSVYHRAVALRRSLPVAAGKNDAA
jgi:glycosyltransferase involved in cell wall biosynthesis